MSEQRIRVEYNTAIKIQVIYIDLKNCHFIEFVKNILIIYKLSLYIKYNR